MSTMNDQTTIHLTAWKARQRDPSLSDLANRSRSIENDQKPSSNMHETNSFPKEIETSIVETLHGGGRGILLEQEKNPVFTGKNLPCQPPVGRPTGKADLEALA
jgi:hypothetical protein